MVGAKASFDGGIIRNGAQQVLALFDTKWL